MVVHSEPKVCPSQIMQIMQIMQIIKSISAKQFFALHPEIKKKYFWGGKLWTQSYFVETIGKVTEKVIREYVRINLKKWIEQKRNISN